MSVISFLAMALWSGLWVSFKVKWFVKRLHLCHLKSVLEKEIMVYQGGKRLIEFILPNIRERN